MMFLIKTARWLPAYRQPLMLVDAPKPGAALTMAKARFPDIVKPGDAAIESYHGPCMPELHRFEPNAIGEDLCHCGVYTLDETRALTIPE